VVRGRLSSRIIIALDSPPLGSLRRWSVQQHSSRWRPHGSRRWRIRGKERTVLTPRGRKSRFGSGSSRRYVGRQFSPEQKQSAMSERRGSVKMRSVTVAVRHCRRVVYTTAAV
jgi:hypothetical protein